MKPAFPAVVMAVFLAAIAGKTAYVIQETIPSIQRNLLDIIDILKDHKYRIKELENKCKK